MEIADDTRRSGSTFVLVPSYNHAVFIEECLRSIIAQTVHPTKLLVIDDGSTDGSPEIIDKVLSECPFDAELIARGNRGLCATLNEGLEQSEDEFFAYLGSDDRWLPDFLEAREAMLRVSPDAVLGFGNCLFINTAGNVTGSSSDNRESQMMYTGGDPKKMLLTGMAPASPTVVYRSSFLSRGIWNRETRLEDYELYLKLVVRGGFAFDPAARAAWRIHERNTSHDQAMMLDEMLAAQARNAEILRLDHEGLDAARAATTLRYARIALQTGDRHRAFDLIRRSWKAADAGTLAGFFLRMMIPLSAIDKFRKVRKRH